VLFEDDGGDEAEGGGVVGEDPDHVDPALTRLPRRYSRPTLRKLPLTVVDMAKHDGSATSAAPPD
jgi:hypothetical protein